MRGSILLVISFLLSCYGVQPIPSELYGQLFVDVQLAPVFSDSKTFCDMIPLLAPQEIVDAYYKYHGGNLTEFVLEVCSFSFSFSFLFAFSSLFCGSISSFSKVARFRSHQANRCVSTLTICGPS